MSVEVEIKFDELAAWYQATTGFIVLSPSDALIVEEHAVMSIEFIQDRWPVKTGLSQAMWDQVLEPMGIGFILFNDVDYATWVHWAGESGSLWNDLTLQIQTLIGPPLARALDASVRAQGFVVANAAPGAEPERIVIEGEINAA